MAKLATSTISGKYGTATFGDPSNFESAFCGGNFRLTVTGGGDFKARLTWLRLRRIHVLRVSEELPRIAYVSLPPSRVCVSFPTGKTPLIWDGVELQPGDLILHSRGERMHQRIAADGRWGLISLSAARLASRSKVMIGRRLTWPPAGRVLQRQPVVTGHLLHLHNRAGRLVESKDKLLTRPEFVRTLEKELVDALVECLSVEDPGLSGRKASRHANIMDSFEDAVNVRVNQPLVLLEICAAIGVPERTLRICCAEILGMSPTKFFLLRRMNMVRTALKRAEPTNASVSEIARKYHFSELGRFAVTYRRIFGELPSATLKAQI